MLDVAGNVIETGVVASTPEVCAKCLGREDSARIAIEVGGQSAWLDELLGGLGHDVIVANARRRRMIYENDSKSDEVDAEHLARVARADVTLLHPIQHRQSSTPADLARARTRDMLISTRTSLINHVRGMLKPFGTKLGSRGAAYFHGWVRDRFLTHSAARWIRSWTPSKASQSKSRRSTGAEFVVRDGRDPRRHHDRAVNKLSIPAPGEAPLAGVTVIVDGDEAGTTDADGRLRVFRDSAPGHVEFVRPSWVVTPTTTFAGGRALHDCPSPKIWMVPSS